MSNRELVISLVNQMPENTPLKKIVWEINLGAGINDSLSGARRREEISADEARQLLNEWAA